VDRSTRKEAPAPQCRRVCVVGPGTRFLSGITYYTFSLIRALQEDGHRCSAVLIRRLLPVWLYPGGSRVGATLTDLRLPDDVERVDGVDWYWGPSLIRAIQLVCRERPEILILQWWTGVVLHTYLILAVVARLLGAKVVIEFHEAQDVGEARFPVALHYVNSCGRFLLGLSAAQLVHSKFDDDLIRTRYRLNGSLELLPHADYDYLPARKPVRPAKPGVINLLYFGVIRPFKGLEDLVAAFDLVCSAHPHFWLTVIGETWEDWNLPAELIAASPYRERITFVNRYVTDEEAAGHFAGADIVVLPYHRSSSSGPLSIAMGRGLPVVVTRVGGLIEAAARYAGAVSVEPHDPPALARGIECGADLVGQHFEGSISWSNAAHEYSRLINRWCGHS
jgi:glycosyltransferase involved in cell wall biosynthesis